jgi:Xaa-Pro aminopeptidase
LNGDPILDYLLESNVTWHTAIVITSSGEAVAFVGQYDKKSVEDTGAYQRVEGYVKGIKEPLLGYLKQLNPSTIAVNYSKGSEIADGLTHGMYLTLKDLLSDIGFESRLISAEPLISALRQRKSVAELALLRQAIAHTQEIFGKVARFIAPGKTEKEIASFMKAEVERLGVGFAWDPSSCPAVFTGPDTAQAHYGPTDRRVEEGHVLNMDFGVRSNGYCSDLQRTFYVRSRGESVAPPDVQRGFDTIIRSIERARQVMKPGVKGIAVDQAARTLIVESGYDEFPHALGHQVGRFAHDGTALLGPAWEKYAEKPFLPLEQGMVFTIEPRLTVPGRGVVTVEEMVLITREGAEYLSDPQREILLI